MTTYSYFENDQLIPTKGKAVAIDGTDVDFFVHHVERMSGTGWEYDAKGMFSALYAVPGYRVSEVTTGRMVAEGKTEKSAITNAQRIVFLYGPDNMRKVVRTWKS